MSVEHEQKSDSEAKDPVKEESSRESVAEAARAEEDRREDPDLEAAAMVAAEAAISKGEDAMRNLPDDPQPHRGVSTSGWLLRSMLVINLALMAVMLVLPDPKTPELSTPTTPTPIATPQTEPELPPVDPPPVAIVEPQPEQERPGPVGTGVTNNQIWSKAFMFFGEGRYDDAAESLMDYERRNPQMLEGRKLDLYTMLSTCLFKAGRMAEAEVYRAKSNSLVNRGYLSADLLDAARKAWSDGRSGEARRYYARFLLQEKRLTPVLRQSVPEAYLRIGDSYRMAADVGAGEGKR